MFVFAAGLYAQDNSPIISAYFDGPQWSPQTDTGITCSPSPPGIFRDDGSYENGYRTVTNGDSTRFVHKMRMPSFPITLTAICITWTALSPSGSLTYDLVVYDTTGPGDQPGNLVAQVLNVSAPSIAIYPLHSRYRYTVNIPLTQRAYYIGVRWDNNPLLPFFISADENGTNGGPAWKIPTLGGVYTWTSTISEFPNFKNHGIRAEGQSLVADGQYTFCRNGLNIPIPQNGAAPPDSVLASGLSNACEVRDVNVRIDTVIHTWDSDLRFYIRKSGVGVKIINNVGGSGDNFINTVLNDSATTPIASGTPPFTGSFQPSNPLTPFNGINPSGYWLLQITDTVSGDSGFLRAWCVVLSLNCPTGIQTIELPNHYILNQNYPNPFNPSTTIKFGLPRNENVRLVVYDMLGREVKVLVNEYKTTGTYEVNFDASSLASGVYFYKLETPNFAMTRKMLLIK
jgi:hypothetical protein